VLDDQGSIPGRRIILFFKSVVQTVSWSSPSLASNDYVSLGFEQLGYEAENLSLSSAKIMHPVTQPLPTYLQGSVLN